MPNRRRPREPARLPLDYLEDVAQVLRVLSHPRRLQIVDRLLALGEAPVHRLTDDLEVSQAAISHHVTQMRRVGLVAAERRGREVWYRIGDPRAVTVLGCVRKKWEEAS